DDTIGRVVGANTFQQVTPASAPSCDCTSGAFFTHAFRVEIDGVARQAVVAAAHLGFTVPRLGTTTDRHGGPGFNAIRLAATTSTSPASTSLRSYFDAWSTSEATGIADQRPGEIDLQNHSSNQTLAQIELIELD